MVLHLLDVDPNGFGFNELLSGIIGMFLGFVGNMAIFRARFTAVEKDIQALKDSSKRELEILREDNKQEWERIRSEFRRLCRDDTQELRDLNRRQRVMMEAVFSIMRKEGITHRIGDIAASLAEALPEKDKDVD